MRDFLLITAIFITAVIAVSAGAWPLYAALIPEQSLEFGKFVKWSALLTVAIATFIVMKRRGMRRITLTGTSQRSLLYLLGGGVVIGFVTLATLGAAFYALDIRVADADKSLAEQILKLFISVIPAAIVVSLIEETYFRGAQCGVLMREKKTAMAVVLPAIFYAGVHFLNPPDTVIDDPEWFYGLTLLLAAPAEICRSSDCVGAAATLFFAGALLGLVRVLGGHLMLCVGIHAGWIAGIKLTRKLTDFNHDSELAFLANGYDHFTGILAAAWLAVLCAWLVKRLVENP